MWCRRIGSQHVRQPPPPRQHRRVNMRELMFTLLVRKSFPGVSALGTRKYSSPTSLGISGIAQSSISPTMNASEVSLAPDRPRPVTALGSRGGDWPQTTRETSAPRRRRRAQVKAHRHRPHPLDPQQHQRPLRGRHRRTLRQIRRVRSHSSRPVSDGSVRITSPNSRSEASGSSSGDQANRHWAGLKPKPVGSRSIRAYRSSTHPP